MADSLFVSVGKVYSSGKKGLGEPNKTWF